MCRRRFRVMRLEKGEIAYGKRYIVALGGPNCNDCDNDFYGGRCWAYYQRPDPNHRRELHAAPPAAPNPSPDDTQWLEALDEAIASVTSEEYGRLKRQHPNNITARLEGAFKSIRQLWTTGKQPRYDDWDALLYVSWYQARQVHLVYAAFEQHPPPPSGRPLQIVDMGCGAWAAPIALAMLEARGHTALLDRKVSVHGIERKRAMTRMGEKMWLEFACAAEARGLPIEFIEMIDEDRIFTSVRESLDSLARDASSEFWLLAIHALYDDESQPEVRRFLADYRKRHASRLRYELLTTDGNSKKRQLLESIGGPCHPRVAPIWNGTLTETTKFRQKIREELKNSGNAMSDKHMSYLGNKVAWNPSNPIERDAIWVRRASQ